MISESPVISGPVSHTSSEPLPVSNAAVLPPAFPQDTPVEECNPIFFISANKLYSIDPNEESLQLRQVAVIPIPINESELIFYDAENVYFQANFNGYSFYAVKISDGISSIVMKGDRGHISRGFALDRRPSSKGIYFSQSHDKLQYFDFQTGQSEPPFSCKCDVSTQYPEIMLNSSDGSKLFYRCNFYISGCISPVSIHDLRNSDNQGLQSFGLSIHHQFILSPDDKYVIIFSDYDPDFNILDITTKTGIKKTFSSSSTSFMIRRVSFSKNGRYLYILEKVDSLEYRLKKIDFVRLLRAFEEKNVENISLSTTLDYIISTRKISMPITNLFEY